MPDEDKSSRFTNSATSGAELFGPPLIGAPSSRKSARSTSAESALKAPSKEGRPIGRQTLAYGYSRLYGPRPRADYSASFRPRRSRPLCSARGVLRGQRQRRDQELRER